MMRTRLWRVFCGVMLPCLSPMAWSAASVDLLAVTSEADLSAQSGNVGISGSDRGQGVGFRAVRSLSRQLDLVGQYERSKNQIDGGSFKASELRLGVQGRHAVSEVISLTGLLQAVRYDTQFSTSLETVNPQFTGWVYGVGAEWQFAPGFRGYGRISRLDLGRDQIQGVTIDGDADEYVLGLAVALTRSLDVMAEYRLLDARFQAPTVQFGTELNQARLGLSYVFF